MAEALAAPRPVEGRHGLPEAVDRPTIVALGLIGYAKELVRQRVQDALPAGRGKGEGALGGGDGLVIRAPDVEMEGQKDETCPSRRGSSRAAARASASRRAARIRSRVAETGRSAERRASRRSMACSQCGALLRQMRQGAERLLEIPHGLAVGRLRHGLLSRLSAVRQGLVPHLPPQGMVRQAFDLLGQPVPSERLEGLDDPGVQHPPPLLEEPAVGHLVREGVLEGVLALGKEARLVEELGRLEVCQTPMQRRLGQLGNSLQQRQGYLRANHRGRLQQALLLGRQTVDARRQHRLHCGRHLNSGQVCARR